MTIECYDVSCANHSCHSGVVEDNGPFCYRATCEYVPLHKVPAGYTAEELDRDNPYTQHVTLES
jgi:hypothetical protein